MSWSLYIGVNDTGYSKFSFCFYFLHSFIFFSSQFKFCFWKQSRCSKYRKNGTDLFWQVRTQRFPGNFCGFYLQLEMEEFFASLPFHTNSRLHVEVNKSYNPKPNRPSIHALSRGRKLQCVDDKCLSILATLLCRTSKGICDDFPEKHKSTG